MFAIIRYLLVDWLYAWRESPGAALSKAVVSGLLSGVAAMILLSLTMAERSAQASLRAFGDTTVVVNEPAMTTTAGRVHSAIPDALQAVGGGVRRHLGSAVEPVEYDGKIVTHFFYDPALLASWGELKDFLVAHPRVLFDDALPEGTRLSVLVGKQPMVVKVARRPTWFKRLQSNECVLEPMQANEYLQRQIISDITLIEVAKGPQAAMKLAHELRAYQVAEKAYGTNITDPGAILQELQNISAAHTQWRSAILLIIAPLVALIFGTLTVLEFRELRYTAALMRSLGTPAWLLWLRHLFENALLALVAALVVLIPCGAYAAEIFNAMGSPSGGWTHDDAQFFFRSDVPIILLALGLGVVVSLIPVLVGLMKPVGRVLP